MRVHFAGAVRAGILGLAIIVACAACTSVSQGQGGSSAGPTSAAVSTSATTSAAASSEVVPVPTPSPSAAVPTSSITATANATSWTRAEALSHADAIKAGPDGALTQLSALAVGSSLTAARAALRDAAAADAVAVTSLAAGLWPTSVRSLVNVYIAVLDSERVEFDKLATDSSVAAMQSDAGQLSVVLTQVQAAETGLINALS